MKVFHGTNIRFVSPKIIQPNRALDFGAGFVFKTEAALRELKLLEVVEL